MSLLIYRNAIVLKLSNKAQKIDREKDTRANKKDKVKEYVIGDVTVEIVNGVTIKLNGNITGVEKLEGNLISTVL